MLKRRERSFAAAGLHPDWIASVQLRVRDDIEERSGARIEATRPEQIEVAEGNCVDTASSKERPPLVPAKAGTRSTRGGMVAAALLLAGCASSGMIDKQASLPNSPKPAAVAQIDPAAQREHERILAAYNGAYDDPHIEAMVSQTVEKLVAASERPDLHYRVTLLNSPVVNAFALPSGQLYVTRGLVALANDSSELASVMSPAMAHVIAHHPEMREDRVPQVPLVRRMATGV